jgi:tRNA(adenine34) deaminase
MAESKLNHHTEVVSGVMAQECGAILSEFFTARRNKIQTHNSQAVKKCSFVLNKKVMMDT